MTVENKKVYGSEKVFLNGVNDNQNTNKSQLTQKNSPSIWNEGKQESVSDVNDDVFGYKPSRTIETKEYDENGNIIKYAVDKNADGKNDYIETFEYDERGNCLKHIKDENGDGKPDYIMAREYNERDNCVKWTGDENGDGKPDYIVTREYDERDNCVKYTEDKNADGNPEYLLIREFDKNNNCVNAQEFGKKVFRNVFF